MDKEEFIFYICLGTTIVIVILTISISILIGNAMRYEHEEKMLQMQNYGEVVNIESEE